MTDESGAHPLGSDSMLMVSAASTALQRFPLKFVDPDVERAYRASFSRARMRSTRLAAMAGLAIWLTGMPLVGSINRAVFDFPSNVAFVTIDVYFVAAFFALRHRTTLGWQQFLGGCGSLLTGLAAIVIATSIDEFALLPIILANTALFAIVFLRLWMMTALLATVPYLVAFALVAPAHTAPRHMFDIFMLLITIATAVGASFLAEQSSREAFSQRLLSERLLLNILPAPIASRLRHSSEPIADAYDEVTILFADIVGFTELAATMTPRQLVEILNDVFSGFDALAEKHGTEKIKTIGDAYMVVCGAPSTRPDHADAITSMALEMLSQLAELNRARGLSLSIRIGINTGSVVAGVIGTRKFTYDLWGDAVNTASRMESHGVKGKVHVSEETRARLGDRFELVSRGDVHVKGKGTMQTWFVEGRRDEHSFVPRSS